MFFNGDIQYAKGRSIISLTTDNSIHQNVDYTPKRRKGKEKRKKESKIGHQNGKKEKRKEKQKAIEIYT